MRLIQSQDFLRHFLITLETTPLTAKNINTIYATEAELSSDLISNFIKDYGYVDVNVETKIEYLETNRVNIYFYIQENL